MLILGIGEVFASIGIWIVSGIYGAAASAFEIFLVLADGTLFTSINYETIIRNSYLVIGIVMLFILAFSLLKGMVNPDDQKQGTSTVKKVIINLLTSAVIMAILPSVFTFAYDFQKSFIYDYNPIGKFFGNGSLDSSVSNTGDSIKNGARQIVNGVYTAFFNINLENCVGDDISKCQEIDGEGEKNFAETIKEVETTGNFGLYGNFSEQVDNGKIDFNFLLSLIGGLLLIYVAISFCFDMAVRLVKLIFYQLIAPLPIFFRVLPDGKLSGTFNTWVKVTLTCYMEVYIRIFVFYFCVYLCTEMLDAPFFDNLITRGFWIRNLSRAFVLMGIITFMRQVPKLISEVTGLDSGNMKLGIREKLAAGGAFTAGAVVGGGLTTGIRNFTNNIDKNKWEATKDLKGIEKFAARAKIVGGTAASAKTWGSVIAGTTSGAVRSGKAGFGAKSEKDMASAASSGSSKAIDARDKRAAYKASHGDTIIGFEKDSFGNIVGVTGSIPGHFRDSIQNMEEFIGLSTSATEVEGYYTKAANTSKAYNDAVEKTYKTKNSYIDLDNKVKALKNLKSSGGITAAEKAELIRLESSLEQMRISESMKKVTDIRSAAYRLSYDHKMNYYGDKEMVAEFESGLVDGFFQLDDKGGSATYLGVNAAGDHEFNVTDGKGVITKMTLDADTYKIYEAMKNGEEFDVGLIQRTNIIRVQDAIDNVNIHRQNLNTRKADEAFRAQQEKKKQEGK